MCTNRMLGPCCWQPIISEGSVILQSWSVVQWLSIYVAFNSWIPSTREEAEREERKDRGKGEVGYEGMSIYSVIN